MSPSDFAPPTTLINCTTNISKSAAIFSSLIRFVAMQLALEEKKEEEEEDCSLSY